MRLKLFKRILFPLTVLMACVTCLCAIQFKPADASSTTVSCFYEADFSNGLPYDWMLYGRSDADAQVTPSVTADGNLKLGSSGGTLSEYYGTVYRFATGLGSVTDFTLEFTYRVTSSRDTSRWIGLLYHTNLTNTKWLSGYGLGFRVSGANQQTTVTHNSSSSSVKFTDSLAQTGSTVDWSTFHTLIVKAEGNVMSHYLDSTDNLLCSYNITDSTYANVLSPQVHGGFALVINYSEIEIQSVKINATRDSQYNAMSPDDDNTPLASYNTAGLKSYTAIVSEINSAEDASALSTNGSDSSLFYLKSGSTTMQSADGTEIPSLTLGDIGFAVLQSGQSSYPKYNGTYPIIYVQDQQGANTLTSYIKGHYDSSAETIQLAMMTDDPALLTNMRTTFNRVRGMLDWSGATVAKNASAWQNVVATTNASFATTAVLSETDATPEAVDYIQKRGITVWVKQTNYSTTSTASIMATGAGGIITANVSETISARSIFENDTNALVRAPLNIAHRGMSMGFYPNSLEGCQASIATGATHVEIDLYVTTDNRVMVMHDDPLYVVCDCHTVGGECSDYISDMTYEQTKNFKVVKESNEFLFPATVLGAGVPIPTLDEMFAWAITDPNAMFYLELKPCDAGHGGGGTLGETYNQRLIDAIKLCIDTYDIADQVMFITSNADLATKAHSAMPGIPLISTSGDNILANNNYYLEYWASINAGIDVNSGWRNTEEFLSLGYLPNYWTYVTEHYIREGGYPVYLNYEAAIISGVYGITNNYPFVFKNNAYRLYNSADKVSAPDLDTLFNNGVAMKYITYGHQEKDVTAYVSSYEYVGSKMYATFKATFTNDYGLQYTLYTSKYEIEFTALPQESTVTFNTDGGTTLESKTITTGETVTKPTDPEKEGFTFGGWLLNGVEFDFSTPIYGDVTLTAKWVVSVTFDVNGGSFIGETQLVVQSGTTINQPSEPNKAGNVFIGWTLNGQPFDFTTPITSSITLVATYKVFAISDYAYLSSVTADKPQITPTGTHQYTSWKQVLIDFGVRISAVDKYMADNSQDFILVDNPDFITYTDKDGNNKLDKVQFRESFLFVSTINLSYEIGDILTIKAGFVFGNYQVKKDLVYICKGSDQAFSLQAQINYTDISINSLYVDKTTTWGWPSIQVRLTGVSGVTFSQYQDCIATMIIEYKTNAGVNKPVANFIEITGAHNGGTFIIRLQDQAYIFQNGDTIVIYENSYISVGDQGFRLTKNYYFTVDSTVSGGYKTSTSTVTFDANGGTLTSSASTIVNTGETVTTPTPPTKDADAEFTYEFAGWTLNGADYNFETLVTGAITLVAKWTATPIPVEPPVTPDPVPETLTATYTGTITAGEKINPAGISIVLTYDDNSTEPVNAGIVEYWYNGEQIVDPINYVFGEELIGTVNITVKYAGLETIMTVEVVAPTEPEDPVDPPVDPEDPTDPEDPVDPPVDPEDPTDPEDPVDPPVDPEEPTDPEDPVDPPVDPEDPTDPEDPVDPPVGPEDPTDPEDPVDPPVGPEDPTDPEEPDNVAVTDVALNVSSIELVVGGTYQLTATITPNNATNTNVIWISNDTSIATIDANGNVTAVSAGTTVIFVETVDGGLRVGCAITVTADTTPENPENPETPDAPQGGCGSAIGSVFIPSIVAIVLAGFTVFVKKKKA